MNGGPDRFRADKSTVSDETVEARLRAAFRSTQLPEPPDRLQDSIAGLPSGGPGARRGRRAGTGLRLLPAVALLVVVGGLVLTAGSGLLQSSPQPSGAPATTLTQVSPSTAVAPSGEPSSTPAIAEVPWSAELATSPLASPSPTAPVGPPCSPDQLAVGNADWGGAGGSMAGGFAIWNVSSSDCIVEGMPLVTIIDGKGTRLRLTEGKVRGTPRGPVLLAAGQSRPDPGQEPPVGTGWVSLFWTNWCGTKPSPPFRLRVALPDGRLIGEAIVGDDAVGPVPGVPRCDAPTSDSGLSVGPFEAASGPEPTQPPTLPAESLRATLELPAQATIGQPLRYSVSLHNPTTEPIPLLPCPSFEQRLNVANASEVAHYVLNCATVPVISPGQTVRFAMVLDVPAALQPTDQAAIVWELDPYYSQGWIPTGPGAKGQISLVAP